MIHRTLASAQREPRPFAGWQELAIVKVTLKDDTTFYRTYVFDQRDKCKRCRHALRRQPVSRWRMASTGHTCEACGNPYAGFVRKWAFKGDDGKYFVPAHGACYGSTGKLH